MVLKPGPARSVEPVEPDPGLKTGRFHALARFASWPALARQTRQTRSKLPTRPTRRAIPLPHPCSISREFIGISPQQSPPHHLRQSGLISLLHFRQDLTSSHSLI
ncbi:hypothetical protein SLEP1_g18946 [Rubroshorea leprosula]|uniref:Uncharacterized protein n=1 Tax=Rubroshorea leprosula TaxID=152421 RepID=A0AAV5J8D7_9ROSI|nr:hypothetical protein SLEP1_g18946 [Rubroshorea leprosula]